MKGQLKREATFWKGASELKLKPNCCGEELTRSRLMTLRVNNRWHQVPRKVRT